jgi:hypothetical protein
MELSLKTEDGKNIIKNAVAEKAIQELFFRRDQVSRKSLEVDDKQDADKQH